MFIEIEVQRITQTFVARYGRAAAVQASLRSEGLALFGDDEGAHNWHRIAKAIARLQAHKPAEAEVVH